MMRATTLALFVLMTALVACKAEKAAPEGGAAELRGLQPASQSPLQAALTHSNCVDNAKPVPFHSQTTPKWCWAASGQMVIEALGNQGEQCTQVNEICKRDNLACKSLDCCLTPKADDCLISGWPPLDLHGLKSQEHPLALSPTEVVNELRCNHRPFLFSWMDSGGGGHMMVAVDFLTDDEGADWIITHDPAYGKAVPIPWLRYEKGFFKHWKDYYQIAKVGP